MLKELGVTLYDAFGYLLPGFVVLAAIAILFPALLTQTTDLPLPYVPTEIGDWAVITIVAYILGHLIQAIAHLLVGNPSFRLSLPATEDLLLRQQQGSGREDDSLDNQLVALAREQVGSILGVSNVISNRWLYAICDEFVVQSDKESAKANREIYIYREGFYRGLTISLVLLSVALALSTLAGGAWIQPSVSGSPARPALLLLVTVVPLLGAWLSFRRFRRFGRYRIWQAILGFLVLRTTPSASQAQEKQSEARPGDPVVG